ncbi:MAG: hypothetical protein ACOC12_00015 [Bacteroidota bacterium]
MNSFFAFCPFIPGIIAYIDPGTGSIILQAVIGAIAGIAIAARIYWQRILRFFGVQKDSDIQKLDDE